MLRDNHKAKLFLLQQQQQQQQQQQPNSERRSNNGHTFIRPNSGDFPTVHRTSTHGTTINEA